MDRLSSSPPNRQLLSPLSSAASSSSDTLASTLASRFAANFKSVSNTEIEPRNFELPDTPVQNQNRNTLPLSSSLELVNSETITKPDDLGADKNVHETLQKIHDLSRNFGGECFTLQASSGTGKWFVVAPEKKHVEEVLPLLIDALNFQQSLDLQDLYSGCDPVHRAMVVQGVSNGMLYANLYNSNGVSRREGRSIGPHFIGSLTTSAKDIYFDLTAKNVLFKNYANNSCVYEGLIVVENSGENKIINGLYDCNWKHEEVDPSDGYTKAITKNIISKYEKNRENHIKNGDGLQINHSAIRKQAT